MSEQKVTTDHEEIKKWAEKYNAKPAIIDDQKAGSDTVGIRLDFPGDYDERYLDKEDTHRAKWEEFFAIFDDSDLAFIYDKEVEGDPSWAYKFIKKDNIDEIEEDE